MATNAAVSPSSFPQSSTFEASADWSREVEFRVAKGTTGCSMGPLSLGAPALTVWRRQ